MIRVELPFHLRTLTQIPGREVTLEVAPLPEHIESNKEPFAIISAIAGG